MLREGLKSIAETHPNLLDGWDYEKNDAEGILLKDNTQSSPTNVNWVCEDCGKRINKQIRVVIRQGHIKCKQCIRKSKRVIPEEKLFSNKHPELLCEWDYEKNNANGVFPDQSSYGERTIVGWHCQIHNFKWESMISARHNGRTSCPECKSIKHSLFRSTPKEGESFADKRKDVLMDWNYEKNQRSPYSYKVGARDRIEWRCHKCNHEWDMDIRTRTKGGKGNGCPACANQVLTIDNCLATRNPELAATWHSTKNGDLTPYDFMAGARDHVWWQCLDCNYEWTASIKSRNVGHHCPPCNMRGWPAYKAISFMVNNWEDLEKTNFSPEDTYPDDFNDNVFSLSSTSSEGRKFWEAVINGDINLINLNNYLNGINDKGINKVIKKKHMKYPTNRVNMGMALRKKIKERDNNTCQACGIIPDNSFHVQVDHIFPVNLGGTNDEENLQVLCGPCNWFKNNKNISNKDLVALRISCGHEIDLDKIPQKNIPDVLLK